MVRAAVFEDIDVINELGKLFDSKFDSLYDMKKILEEEFSKVFVYIEEDNVVGFIHVTELYETIDIVNIVVNPEYRNKGIGSNLIDYMLSDANNLVKTITLEVAVSNTDAISLYEKFDFEIINTRKSYYNDEDAYLMGKVVK